jgi:hypothetical protein
MAATPLHLGTSPFSWTCGLGRFGRRPGGQGVQRPAPHHLERVPPPLKPLAPSSPVSSLPCARPLTRGIPVTPRMPNAAPHACASGGRPLVRGRVWRHPGARARDACVPPSVGVTEPMPPRGATPKIRMRLMPPGHRTARGGHTPERERCGACWSSAQRAPEPAYARSKSARGKRLLLCRHAFAFSRSPLVT